MPKEGDETVEAKEQRSRALDSQVRPLALCLDAKWACPSSKVTSRLQRFMRIADDLFCRLGGVGGKDGLGGTLTQWITSEDPPDR